MKDNAFDDAGGGESGGIINLDEQLPALAAEANKYHLEGRSAARAAIVAFWYAGKALLAAKEQLRHGQWLLWLEANFDGDPSTAQRYMQIAANTARVQDLDIELSQREALKAIRSRTCQPDEPTSDDSSDMLPLTGENDADSVTPRPRRHASSTDDTGSGATPDESLWEPAGVMELGYWLWILMTARLFASDHEIDGCLATVRLEATDSSIVAVATNRFLLGVARADYDGDPFMATIGVEQVDALINVAKNTFQGIRDFRQVQLGIGDKFGCCFSSGETQTVRLSDHEFPDYRKLLFDAAGADRADSDGFVCFSPTYLAKFDKVKAGRETPMVMWIRSRKAAVVQIGENFVGAIMPVKPPDDVTVWKPPEWITQG